MSELKPFDDIILDDEDEYETPRELYETLCVKYDIQPQLDVCADALNKKCDYYFDIAMDGLYNQWRHDVWCNPPHSKTEKFVKRAQSQWKKNNINILMIVPANSICAHFFDLILAQHDAVYDRIPGRPRFLKNGKLSRFPSRNSYFAVIWVKRHSG